MQKEDTITFRTETSLLANRKLKHHYLPFIETSGEVFYSKFLG